MDPNLETITKMMKISNFMRGPYGIAIIAFGGSLALMISGAIAQGSAYKGRVLKRMWHTLPTTSMRV